MKKLLLPFLLFSLGLQAQTASKDEMSIREVLSKQNAAWNRGDLDNFMIGYWQNDSVMFIGKSGITYGWENTLKNYQKGYADTSAMGKLTFTLLHFNRLAKEYYHVTGKWFLNRSIGDLGGHFTLVFRKIKGKWLIVSDHSS